MLTRCAPCGQYAQAMLTMPIVTEFTAAVRVSLKKAALFRYSG
jgi:hypothetical protein